MNKPTPDMRKPTLAVHKLTSCSGCQAVILNLAEDLLALSRLVQIVHFVEAGLVSPEAQVDIALVEGSISTPADEQRIRQIRARSRQLISIGACACSGGVQALRNVRDSGHWPGEVYADAARIDSLAQSRPVQALVPVELELWGCPIEGRQLVAALAALLHGIPPLSHSEKLCQQCKRLGNICVLVSQGEPCMGPVTRTGCGALCPAFGAPCYTCFGPAEQPNTEAMGLCLLGLGLPRRQVAERFASISVGAPDFAQAYRRWCIPIREEK